MLLVRTDLVHRERIDERQLARVDLGEIGLGSSLPAMRSSMSVRSRRSNSAISGCALAHAARRARRGTAAAPRARRSCRRAPPACRRPGRESAQNAVVSRCDGEIAALRGESARSRGGRRAGARALGRSRRSSRVCASSESGARALSARGCCSVSSDCQLHLLLARREMSLSSKRSPIASAAPQRDKLRPGLFDALERHRKRRLQLLGEQRHLELLEQPAEVCEPGGSRRPPRGRARPARGSAATTASTCSAWRASRSGRSRYLASRRSSAFRYRGRCLSCAQGVAAKKPG